MPQLNDDDCRAVDWIMQTHSMRTSADDPGRPLAAGEIENQRLAAAGRILETLSQYPACDPPGNLVQQTLRRIEASHAPAPAIAGEEPVAARAGSRPS